MNVLNCTPEQLARYLHLSVNRLYRLLDSSAVDARAGEGESADVCYKRRGGLTIAQQRILRDLCQIRTEGLTANERRLYKRKPLDVTLNGIDSFAQQADKSFIAFLKGNTIAAYLAYYLSYQAHLEPETFKSLNITTNVTYPESDIYRGGVIAQDLRTGNEAELGITLYPNGEGTIAVHVKWTKEWEYLQIYDNVRDATLRKVAGQAIRCLRPTYKLRTDLTNPDKKRIILNNAPARNSHTKRKPGLPGSRSVQSTQGRRRGVHGRRAGDEPAGNGGTAPDT